VTTSCAADTVFSRQFSRELAEWEGIASPRDREALEAVLTEIAADHPYLPGRFASFYHPLRPSYLYRRGNMMIHYRVDDDEHVEFLNLFSRPRR